VTGSFSGGSQNVDDVSVVSGLFTVKINFRRRLHRRCPVHRGPASVRAPPWGHTRRWLRARNSRPPRTPLGLSLPFSERQTECSIALHARPERHGQLHDADGLSRGLPGCLDRWRGVKRSAPTPPAPPTPLARTPRPRGANSVYAPDHRRGRAHLRVQPGHGRPTRPSSAAKVWATPPTGVEIQGERHRAWACTSRRGPTAPGSLRNTNASNFGTVLLASNTGGGGAGHRGARPLAPTARASSPSTTPRARTRPWRPTTNGTGPAGRFQRARWRSTARPPPTGTQLSTETTTVNGTLNAKNRRRAQPGHPDCLGPVHDQQQPQPPRCSIAQAM